IFLINNGGYTIERGYLGKDETYNHIASWSYADLPKLFRRDTSARTFVVNTVQDLHHAINAPNEYMLFVQSLTDPTADLVPLTYAYDAHAPVSTSSNKGRELNYGPRGPQHRNNVQLRPATHRAPAEPQLQEK